MASQFVPGSIVHNLKTKLSDIFKGNNIFQSTVIVEEIGIVKNIYGFQSRIRTDTKINCLVP